MFLADPGGSGSSSYGPNFARCNHHRTEPIFVQLATDPAMRREIAGTNNDERIANAMVEIDATARRASFRYDGWEGFTYTGNTAVLDYLNRHATTTAQANQ